MLKAEAQAKADIEAAAAQANAEHEAELRRRSIQAHSAEEAVEEARTEALRNSRLLDEKTAEAVSWR